MAVVDQDPPQPGGPQAAVAVVGDNEITVADADVLHDLLHPVRWRHERILARIEIVLHLLDVVVDANASGASDMRSAVGVKRVAFHDSDVGIVQVFFEPVRLHQKLGIGISFSSHGEKSSEMLFNWTASIARENHPTVHF